MGNTLETDEVTQRLVEVAEEFINPRFRALAAEDVSEKNPGDLVTVADHEAEVALTAWLNDRHPDAVVLGEEAFAADPSIKDRYAVAAHAFTVDPVDGTKNFVSGSANHAVMVAELRDGVCVRGWVHQPQHGRTYVAERGAGAYCNGERLSTTPPASDEPVQWNGKTSRRRWLGDVFSGPLGLGELTLTWACCGVDYPHLIAGDADYLLYAHDHPWDHEPGGLLLTESGGWVAPLPSGGLIAACSRDLCDEVGRRISSQPPFG